MFERRWSLHGRWATAAVVAAVAASCGGGTRGERGAAPGSDHAAAGDDDGVAVFDGGVPGDAAGDAAPPAPVTFALHNTHEEKDLVFSVDRGWQPVIFAYSGEPPNATPILMFPKHCTASCDTAEAERCPHCPEPKKVKDIKAAEKREVVAPGETLDVPWDGQVFAYEKTRGTRNGRKVGCECHTQEPVPAGTYTVRACGFRVTEKPNTPSKLQCVQGEMELPSEDPVVVELAFPDPKAAASARR